MTFCASKQRLAASPKIANRYIVKSKRVIFAIFLAITLIGCDKSDVSPGKSFLIEVVDPTCNTDKFEYDHGRLTGYKRFFGNRIETTATFSYQNDRLIEITTNRDCGDEYKVELEYDQKGKRTKEKIVFTQNQQGQVVTLSNFTYDGNGNLLSKTSSYSDSTYSYSSETNFEWNNGNLVRLNCYIFGPFGKQLWWDRTLIYDTKRSYANQDLAFVYLIHGVIGYGDETALSNNNPISTTEQSYGPIVDRGSYSFSYDPNGYPVGYKYKVEGQEFPEVQMKYK